MSRSPRSRICGSTPMTRKMEIIVPRPRQVPMEDIVLSEVMRPIMSPAEASIAPEVMMVGKAWLSVSTMASLIGRLFFSSK